MALRSDRNTVMVNRQPGRGDTITSLLSNVRKAQQRVRHLSRDAIESIVSQLLDVQPQHPEAETTTGAFHIEELARLAGTTTRNVRLYRERGLLPAPGRDGRLALYGDSHLARLRMIVSMLDRGYKIAHVKEMIDVWESGGDISDVLGVEAALIGGQWAGERAESMSHQAAAELAGGRDHLEQLAELGLVRIRDTSVDVLRPKLLHSFREASALGIELPTILDVHTRVSGLLHEISEILVRAGADYYQARIDLNSLAAGNTDLAELSRTMLRFRAITTEAVAASMASAIDDSIRSVLSEYLAALLAQPDLPEPTE